MEDPLVPHKVKEKKLIPLQYTARTMLTNLVLATKEPMGLRKGLYPNSAEYVSPVPSSAIVVRCDNSVGEGVKRASPTHLPKP